VTRVTDDPTVVIERDTAVVAVELGAEEYDAGRIGRYGLPQSHPTAVIENAALRAEVVRAGHGPGHREPVRVSLAPPVSSAVELGGTTSTGHTAFCTSACDVPPTTSVRIGP
jgi:hypothetical protein